MKKIFILNFILLILLSCKTEENTEFPKWINELRLNASKTLQTELNATHINIPDDFRERKYFVFCLKGKGNLEKAIDPFETIAKMFSFTSCRTDCNLHRNCDSYGLLLVRQQ